LSQSPFFVLSLRPGVLIRDPETGRLATDGEELPRNSFWSRLLADGDVEEDTPEEQVEQNEQNEEPNP
jgi:hypothetical protein